MRFKRKKDDYLCPKAVPEELLPGMMLCASAGGEGEGGEDDDLLDD